MNDPGSTSGVWLEATAIVSRFPPATIIPAAVLGEIAEVPHYSIEEHPLLDNVLTYVSAALAYYLYLAYTHWSLSTPASRNEKLVAVAALKRGNALVRSRFWFIFAIATLAFVLEEAFIHIGVVGGYLASASHTWGGWIGSIIGRLHHFDSVRTPHTEISVLYSNSD